jgi:hypothetical protein
MKYFSLSIEEIDKGASATATEAAGRMVVVLAKPVKTLKCTDGASALVVRNAAACARISAAARGNGLVAIARRADGRGRAV